MEFFLHFLFGFTVAVIGLLIPGLLNMTAAKISMNEGRRNALLFSLGVITIVAFQTWIALLFARFLDQRPDLIGILQKIALGIFICITVYFLFLAKDPRGQNTDGVHKSKKRRFFLGLFLSTINLFPLPFWVYMSITFSAFGWFDFTKSFIALCVIGSALGTLGMLVLYAQFFNHFKNKKKVPFNVNHIIGGITAAISVATVIKIINDSL